MCKESLDKPMKTKSRKGESTRHNNRAERRCKSIVISPERKAFKCVNTHTHKMTYLLKDKFLPTHEAQNLNFYFGDNPSSLPPTLRQLIAARELRHLDKEELP